MHRLQFYNFKNITARITDIQKYKHIRTDLFLLDLFSKIYFSITKYKK